MTSLLIGVLCGLRALTPAAATAWAVRFGWVSIDGVLSWIGSLPVAVGLTALAILELVGDKLPSTPARTALPGLAARIFTGAVTGGCVGGASGTGKAIGAVLGAVGGVAGAYGGYAARTGTVRALGLPDVAVALVEDAIAIAGALWIVRGIG